MGPGSLRPIDRGKVEDIYSPRSPAGQRRRSASAVVFCFSSAYWLKRDENVVVIEGNMETSRPVSSIIRIGLRKEKLEVRQDRFKLVSVSECRSLRLGPGRREKSAAMKVGLVNK